MKKNGEGEKNEKNVKSKKGKAEQRAWYDLLLMDLDRRGGQDGVSPEAS